MIFAADTEECSLLVFPDVLTASAYCNPVDVEATLWRFWDDEGAPLMPAFTVPNERHLFTTTTGVYSLVPVKEGQYEFLWDALRHIRQVIGEMPFTDVRAVRDYLVTQCGGQLSPC
ncbi:hypothetical protein [Massilia antarctica]|uniref:hypothetical protein n=1 Tax=Massilia antarctica TaxID=2765360 RepID=UPI0006BB779C|nr:hypothetical protein [Massilia sp. H27-R4]MCY0913944.1 hypothetical protein [Massilia sp. H27-R4]CUI04320.1 hypothetical protein BN2497_3417 [Janthinobacterium sp. CG23_2]CUU28106.1 hypothetical protein BN3177_3417 [Janthinobacterium sp. CG23_2]